MTNTVYEEAVEEAIAILLDSVINSENRYVVKAAICALEKIAEGDEKTITALEKLLDSTEDEIICLQAAYTLGTIAVDNSKILILFSVIRQFTLY